MIYFVISGHLNLTIGMDGFDLEDKDIGFNNNFSIMEKINLQIEIDMIEIDDTNIVIWILSTIYPKSLCGLVG